MPGLRVSRPELRSLREPVPFQDGDLPEVAGEDASGEQAGQAAPDDDGVFA
jgi:hypothetical protein